MFLSGGFGGQKRPFSHPTWVESGLSLALDVGADDMYGMVNKLLIEALTDEYGGETWSKIEERSGADADFFLGMEQYPDDITYNMVATAADIGGISAEQLLEMFGKKWVEMTARREYGHYYAMADNLFDFLENLNTLHQSLGAGLPELHPPSFALSRLDTRSAQLQYMSDRPGLTYFVVGLIKGLALHYDQNVTVTITAEKRNGADQDQFRISIV